MLNVHALLKVQPCHAESACSVLLKVQLTPCVQCSMEHSCSLLLGLGHFSASRLVASSTPVEVVSCAACGAYAGARACLVSGVQTCVLQAEGACCVSHTVLLLVD